MTEQRADFYQSFRKRVSIGAGLIPLVVSSVRGSARLTAAKGKVATIRCFMLPIVVIPEALVGRLATLMDSERAGDSRQCYCVPPLASSEGDQIPVSS